MPFKLGEKGEYTKSGKRMAVGGLLVTGCWLLVAGYWLLVAGCWLLVRSVVCSWGPDAIWRD